MSTKTCRNKKNINTFQLKKKSALSGAMNHFVFTLCFLV